MPHPARRSAAGDAAEWEAEDVTAILNEEAANSRRRSPRERKRESRDEPNATNPSSRRIQVDEPIVSTSDAAVPTTASPSRRQSGRLQARKPLLVPTRANRRNVFEIPNDPEPKAVTRASLKAVKKLRPLNKRPQNVASPFKGKGILETRTNALVNLDDSPRKRPVRKRIEKIGRSLHKSHRPANKPKASRATTGREPFDGEGIFEASQREELGQSSSELARSLARGSPPGEGVPTKSSKQSSSSRSRHSARLAKEAGHEIGAENIPEAHVVDDVIEESQRNEEDYAANDEEPSEAPEGNPQRPLTRAERDAAERTAAEEEAKREQMVKDALYGIETAAQVHGCMDAWTDSLVAAAEIAENRASSGPESTKGKACAREFKKMALIYKKLYSDNAWSPRGLNHEERETLRLLKRRCKHISGFHYKPHLQFDLERKRMVRDLYEHLIPSSLELAKRALKAWFQKDELSMTALREIYQLLKITTMLVRSARDWKPRPELGNAVKRKTQSDIKPNVETIVENYRRAIDEDGREKFIDELELRQKQNLERQQAEYMRRREAVLARHRRYRHPSYHDDAMITGSPVSSSQPEVIDIDDSPPGNEQAVPESRHSERAEHVHGSVAGIRPSIRREPTEDIPPPDEMQWTENELTVLVNSLQEFTSESRWEDIIDAYGGPRGRLEKYDMDQIMAKARWVKQTMARQLDEELDESWDWLRSVPG